MCDDDALPVYLLMSFIFAGLPAGLAVFIINYFCPGILGDHLIGTALCAILLFTSIGTFVITAMEGGW